jgi:hypothetical protein
MAWMLFKGSLLIVCGLLFWAGIDGVQASPTHIPFQMFDARTMWGMLSWICAISFGALIQTHW